MSKTKSVVIVLLYCLLGYSCSKEENNPIEPQDPEWETVFFDDFNRENTANGDLGSNWKVFNATNGSIMQITNNEVRAEQDSAEESCPYAVYFQDVNYSFMRVSVKARTGPSVESPTIVLFARSDTSWESGYCVGYDSNFFQGGPGVTYIDPTGRMVANTTYILEIITDTTGFEATMYDSAFGYFPVSSIGGSLVSGKVGFMAGQRSPNVMYVDEFKIEILE